MRGARGASSTADDRLDLVRNRLECSTQQETGRRCIDRLGCASASARPKDFPSALYSGVLSACRQISTISTRQRSAAPELSHMTARRSAPDDRGLKLRSTRAERPRAARAMARRSDRPLIPTTDRRRAAPRHEGHCARGQSNHRPGRGESPGRLNGANATRRPTRPTDPAGARRNGRGFAARRDRRIHQARPTCAADGSGKRGG